MSVINANPLLAAAGGDYQISRSVRLRSSASAYFNRTMTTPTNSLKWTWNGWVKLGAVTGYQDLFFAGTSGSAYGGIWFNSGTLCVSSYNGSGYPYNVTSVPVYRDPSAWYMVTIVYDSTQATNTNRIQMWVNNQQITSFTSPTWPTQNTSYQLNTAVQHNIGNGNIAGAGYFDGYLTEINFIDGQALTPSSFGEYNAITGVWQPKKYGGTYGTNGFYLNFSDNSAATAAAIGKDSSGNGNNWTPNNISVTSGVTYDSMLDTPTPYADGGNGRGNYPTVNPLCLIGTASTVSNGNLTQTESGANNSTYLCTMAIPPNSGKWYFEMTATAISGNTFYPVTGLFPVGKEAASVIGFAGYAIDGIAYYASGTYYANASSTGLTGSAVGAAGNTRCFAYDSDTGKLWTRVNGGAWENSGDPVAGTNPRVTLSTAFSYYPYSSNNSSTNNANFGQRPFSYTPPTGFKALNTQNLPESTIKKGNQYFNTLLYTGNSTGGRALTGLGFQPDLVWIKSRSNAYDHELADTARGATKTLQSNNTAAEFTSVNYLQSFDADGFTLGNWTGGNGSGATFVSWSWKKGATQGFDIVTYTGTGANRTVAHSLGVAPSMIILKQRNAVDYWVAWHSALANTEYLLLNSTNAKSTAATYWNSTSPTSSVFSLGTDSRPNGSGTTYVAYLFAEVAGFSKFGSYTGNGSADGPFVYCGFRPKFVMIKRTDSSTNGNWMLLDSVRDTYNVEQNVLYANLPNAEATGGQADFLSNGFKIRTGTGSNVNESGGTYIFAAFAENPFKNSLAR